MTPEAAPSAGERNQAPTRKAAEAGGTSERLRLSNIFHRFSAESGLGTRFPSAAGTRGRH